MGYISNHLSGGEEILYEAKLHWANFLSAILLGGLTFGVVGVSVAVGTSGGSTVGESLPLGACLGALPGLLFFAALGNAVAVWISTEMGVTNRRVIGKTGLIRRKSMDLRLRKVEAVHLEQSLVGRMLGYGTVVLVGAGGSNTPFQFIAAPTEARSRITEAVEADEAVATRD